MSEFYDEKKQCRKTAWDTPEHLSDRDWDFIAHVLLCMSGRAVVSFWRLLNTRDGLAFLYRAIGWPEGANYCRDLSYFKTTGFPGLLRMQPKLLQAFKAHQQLERVLAEAERIPPEAIKRSTLPK